ncbi:MAG TPA: hypothetical protein PLJ04_00925 [Candidatus Saccharibacteria bacterium]|nr:hypothetical protein [Candidatus Saccharibacteria bacterium]MCB9817531.1 hypothetical protein [Candidatus Nomurabacteria bacterium]HPR10120.1 hypothetical protein [Candidatus Saccharibacteria bacterium]
MTTTTIALIIAALVVGGAVFIWFILRSEKTEQSGRDIDTQLANTAKTGVDKIFDEEFREELRNRGRLHFEKIIGENAMFLQQDLRLTTTQLNEYMKTEIKRTLQSEFSKYEESITTAKDLALESIEKTQAVIEQQRLVLEKQMTDEAAAEKARMLSSFEKNMADIVNHYILEAIGNEIDLTVQLDYIFGYLEENKQAIMEDIKSGS